MSRGSNSPSLHSGGPCGVMRRVTRSTLSPYGRVSSQHTAPKPLISSHYGGVWVVPLTLHFSLRARGTTLHPP